MFNNIEHETYQKIKDMLYCDHDYYLNSIGALNKLYNASYVPKTIKNDILDIYLNDVYDNINIVSKLCIKTK